MKSAIPGFSKYIATSEGFIIGINGQYLLAKPRPDGYRQVEILNDDGEYRLVYVHRLIACAFLNLDLDDDKSIVDHKDMDRSNCRLDNLEIVSSSVNNLRKYVYLYEFDTATEKRCRRCNQIKLRSLFGVKKASKDGISAYCKSCSNY